MSGSISARTCPFLDDRVIVDQNLRHAPIDLRAHADLEQRLDSPRGLHFLDHVTDGDGRREVLHGRGRTVHRANRHQADESESKAGCDREPAHPAPGSFLGGEGLLELFRDCSGVGHRCGSCSRRRRGRGRGRDRLCRACLISQDGRERPRHRGAVAPAAIDAIDAIDARSSPRVLANLAK